MSSGSVNTVSLESTSYASRGRGGPSQRHELHPRLAAAAIIGLEAAGHIVTVLDLYAKGFQPAMTNAERHAYHGDQPVLDPLVGDSVAAVRDAEMLVFVYPTWWSSLPAMLKGWLEKVMLPGVAFVFDDAGKVRPGLQNVRIIVGISSYGSSRPAVAVVNDNGRRILMRALRLNTGWRTKRLWLGFYGSDNATHEQRTAHRSSATRDERAVRTLLVHCHPRPRLVRGRGSDAALKALRAAGHEIRVTDCTRPRSSRRAR